VIGLLAVGRFRPPQEQTPAEVVQSAKTFIEQRNWVEALAETKRLLELFPNSHIYLDQAARLSAELNQPIQQAAYLERFITASPDPSEACPALTHAYWKAGEVGKMLDASRRCLELAPTNSDLKFDFALATERAGKTEEALSAYHEGQLAYPGYTDFTIGHARMLLRSGRANEAWAEISPVIAANPGISDAELVAALAAEKIGLADEARAILERALKVHPDNSELKEAYSRMQNAGASK
jgi:tetratricopeptide (TPR) repeat protein